MKVTGGNTRISDGGLAAPGNCLQKRLGIEDSADAKGAEKAAESLQYGLKVKGFDKITDLAASYGVPPLHLETTVSHYNQMIKVGSPDEFGKTLDQDVRPLDTPPFMQ